jgi:hypothetical protein
MDFYELSDEVSAGLHLTSFSLSYLESYLILSSQGIKTQILRLAQRGLHPGTFLV